MPGPAWRRIESKAVTQTPEFQTVIVSLDGPVGLIRLNRPKSLNALNRQMTSDLGAALRWLDDLDDVHVLVLAGDDNAFAAGADIAEIADKTLAEVYAEDLITATWEDAARCRKPLVAAVSGHALGGGCELAMMCDIIVASKTARFALPEARIGIIPGAGGTQRLTRVVGKAVAMDMVLSGRVMLADEALARGLVSRVVPQSCWLEEAIALAADIARASRPVLRLAKEAVNHAQETTLSQGIHLERRLLYTTFALEDRREGMTAFLEKRTPVFRHR